MDKRSGVIESIQKLLSLGVSDEEIAENLFDVGVEKMDAAALIREARTLNAAEAAKKAATSAPVQSFSQNAGAAQQVPVEQRVLVNPKTADDDSLNMDEEIATQAAIDRKAGNIAGLKVKDAKVPKALPADEEDMAQALTQEDSAKEVPAQLEPKPISQQKPAVQTVQQPLAQPQSQQQTDEDGGAIDQNIRDLEKFVSNRQKTPVVSQPSAQKIPAAKTVPVEPTVSQAKSSKDFAQEENIWPEADSSEYSELWKKGIVVAVNSKLSEMKHLKDDIDAELQEKIDQAIRKELYQFKVLLDSQKELLVSSNREALEQKQKEIVFIIDAKIAELRQYNKNLSENLAAIEENKRQQKEALAQVSAALEEAKRTKTQLVVEMNSELIKSKSSAQAFIDSASTHVAQMDARINKALELEKNIAEGMLAQAEQRIETLTIQRADDLIANLQVELNKLQSESKKISPELIEQKIAVLDEFRKQFLTSMQQSLAQINIAVEELNRRNDAAQRALDEKTLAIDAKLEELTKFEKELTQRLAMILGK